MNADEDRFHLAIYIAENIDGLLDRVKSIGHMRTFQQQD